MGLLQKRLKFRATLRVTVLSATMVAACRCTSVAYARDAGDPIQLRWEEGDVSGFASIRSADDDQLIGFVEYAQSRRGDLLTVKRVSRFTDGSSDEDQAEAYVGATLRAVRGTSIIRDANGHVTVDLTIDVANGRIAGYTDTAGDRRLYDEDVSLPPATYWGPLLFIVLKNFDENAEDGRVVFRTVAPTPQPRVFDMEIRRIGQARLIRPGGSIDAVRFGLQPAFPPLVDRLVHVFVPDTTFFVAPTSPPALVRFAGPRNYSGQEIRLE